MTIPKKHRSNINRFIQRVYGDRSRYTGTISGFILKHHSYKPSLPGITLRRVTSKVTAEVDSGTITLNKHNRASCPLPLDPPASLVFFFRTPVGLRFFFSFTHHYEIYTIQWFTFCIYLCIIPYLLFLNFIFKRCKFDLQHLVRKGWGWERSDKG